MASETRTIKIRLNTYQVLKVLAAQRGEKLMELVDRLAQQEQKRGSEGVTTVPNNLGDKGAIPKK
jgi:hypothetical protein